MAPTRRRAWALTAGGLVAGVLGTLGVQTVGRARPFRCPLEPVWIGSEAVLFPPHARLHAAAPALAVSWAPPDAARTRCGVRADAEIREARGGIPEGASHCWRQDLFEGGSSEGDCPETMVCVARRGNSELTCASDDRTCEAVVDAFVHPSTR